MIRSSFELHTESHKVATGKMCAFEIFYLLTFQWRRQGGGQEGKLPPPTFILGCFSSSCKSVEKIFSRVYPPPDPPKLSSVHCSTNETSRENIL